MATTVGKYSVTLMKDDKAINFSPSDIIEVNITEDIFTPCMYASIVFYDKVGYSEILELTGNDSVIISYEVEDITIQKVFTIYDFTSVQSMSQLQGSAFNVTTWFLVEPQFIALTHFNFSKSWGTGVKGHTIIKDICKNMCGIPLTSMSAFEETVETFDNFYMPYWTPLESINWIKQRCSGAKSLVPGFLFFSNKNGINCQTIDTLVTSPIRELNTDKTKTRYIFTAYQDSGDDFNLILDWSLNPPDKHATIFLSGATKHGYDPTTKKLLINKYTYSEMIKNHNILGKMTLFPDISNTSTKITFDCETDAFMKNIYESEFIKRYSKQLSLNMMVRGHTRRYAGMIIDILWKGATSAKPLHGMYQGLYLVRTIRHQFTNADMKAPAPNYRQHMTCLKTGYNNLEITKLHEVSKEKQIMEKY